MIKVIEYLGKQSNSFLIALGFVFVLVVLLGIVDYLTGPELSFSIFYLLPLFLIAWFNDLT